MDIIGFDSYPGANNYGSQRFWFDKLHHITEGKKLIAMSENGPIPDPDDCFRMGAVWSYFMSWSDLVTEQNEDTHIVNVYKHPAVITLESDNQLWRSSLYPDTWYPGYKDTEGRFYHDFSYAGYHLGEESIPSIDQHIVNVTEAPYFADNTGTEDVTTILQTALDDVGVAGGGVVYLPEGSYLIRENSSVANADAALHIKYDSVVLRGDGPDRTFLFHDQTELRQKSIIHIRSAWSNWDTNFGTQSYIRTDLMEPTRIIPVESVEGFSVGDLVVVRNNFTTAFVSEHLMEGIWDNTWIDGVMFLRKIDSIDVTTRSLIIDVPTRYYLKTRDAARVYHAGEHIKECGIENLSVGNRDNPKSGWGEEDYNVNGTGAYDVHFSHVIYFKYAQDCWVKNVHTYKPEANVADIEVLSNCLLLEMCRNITVDSCDFEKSQYEGGGGNGYMFTLSGNDCLIKNSRANDGRHNYDFKMPYSNGNVILNCRGENSKYSSDFHMYLSMANLIDGFTVNGDYLECAFRPYGGEVLHGYPSTQSVFYNTYGENYHSGRDYIVDSRQFNWGIVTGTSGPAGNVKTTPVSGSQDGYTFDTSPEDLVEGENRGKLLRPTSLYCDQLKRRLSGYTPGARFYEVQVEVRDAFTGEVLDGVEVQLNDSIKYTGESGTITFFNMPQWITLSALMDNYLDYAERNMIINSDTVIRLQLDPVTYQVVFELLDENTREPFWGANVYLNDINKSTDDLGRVTYEIPSGTFHYLISKLSYREETGELQISSDTLFTFNLVRIEAYMKFRLRKEGVPVNYASVVIASDSILTNNLGISLFEHMEINRTYEYTVRKDGYHTVAGSLYLVTDTTIAVEMIPDSVDAVRRQSLHSGILLFPNPASETVYMEIPENCGNAQLQISDMQGRILGEMEAGTGILEQDISWLAGGMYYVKVIFENNAEWHLLLKN